ncbi:hypothetical protein BH20CHL2_BH20CHL2_07970 [soil metagenome]
MSGNVCPHPATHSLCSVHALSQVFQLASMWMFLQKATPFGIDVDVSSEGNTLIISTPDTSVRGYEDANSASKMALVLIPWWNRSMAYDSLWAWLACWGSP